MTPAVFWTLNWAGVGKERLKLRVEKYKWVERSVRGFQWLLLKASAKGMQERHRLGMVVYERAQPPGGPTS